MVDGIRFRWSGRVGPLSPVARLNTPAPMHRRPPNGFPSSGGAEPLGSGVGEVAGVVDPGPSAVCMKRRTNHAVIQQ